MNSVTRDSIALRGAGVVHITQPSRGHRFTLDSILLADFCRIKPEDRVLEPGAGTGVVSVLLAKKFPQSTFFALEVQRPLAELCRSNAAANNLGERVIIIERDIRGLDQSISPRTFDVIVANPPYTKSGAGRRSPVASRQVARHDETASIGTWLDLQALLKNRGRYVMVFPAARLSELMMQMRSRKLEPKRLRLAHPHADKPASLALIEAVKGAGVGLDVAPPLIVHERGGEYSEEMREIYSLI